MHVVWGNAHFLPLRLLLPHACGVSFAWTPLNHIKGWPRCHLLCRTHFAHYQSVRWSDWKIGVSYRIVGSFEGEKLSRFCSNSQTFSLWNWGAWHLLAATPAKYFVKVFSVKILFPPNRKSFLPQKFPPILYLMQKKRSGVWPYSYPGGSGVLIRTAGLLLNKYLLYGIVNLLVSSGVVMATRP